MITRRRLVLGALASAGVAGLGLRALNGGQTVGAATATRQQARAREASGLNGGQTVGAATATDVLVVGGGVGGVAAALAALRLGRRVVLAEETDWIGGQLTAQAVPPDEHPWIETTGCTASYRRFRDDVRAYYRRHYPLRRVPFGDAYLNPGSGTVSRLCHEPRVALAVLEATLAPYQASGQLTILLRHRPVAAAVNADTVGAVTLSDDATGAQRVVEAPYVLDATEFGDLLPLAGVEYVTGAESQAETGEPHALAGGAQPQDQQAVSWCFALDYLPGEDHTIPRPTDYGFWKSYQAPFWPGPQLGWTDVDPETLAPRTRPLFDGPTERDFADDLWHFRRVFFHNQCLFGLYASDVTTVNWPQIDYWLRPLVDVTETERQTALREAGQLSLSWLYWLQTEAPRHDKGYGYPGLRLRADVVGTDDGLAKHVYVRESRRIKAQFTVKEQHLGVAARPGQKGAERFPDTVGIGSYRIDLHPSTGGRTYLDIASYPFQIPLGALIPQQLQNLLPAAKNIGTTHITNGCYRLHPVEWNIGEAAGALAAFCLAQGKTPQQVRATATLLADFQRTLSQTLGVVLAWPDALVQEVPDRYPFGGGG